MDAIEELVMINKIAVSHINSYQLSAVSLQLLQSAIRNLQSAIVICPRQIGQD